MLPPFILSFSLFLSLSLGVFRYFLGFLALEAPPWVRQKEQQQQKKGRNGGSPSFSPPFPPPPSSASLLNFFLVLELLDCRIE